MSRLGHVQRDVLAALVQHGEWSPGFSGWLWDTESNTRRVLDSLVRAGYVTRTTKQIQRSMRHVGSSRTYTEERVVYRAKTKAPPCLISMGCLCAAHARGVAASKPCDTTERG